jgi:hypothetical protein
MAKIASAKARSGRLHLNPRAVSQEDRTDERRHYIDRLLDAALEQTFPASDAVTIVLTKSVA